MIPLQYLVRQFSPVDSIESPIQPREANTNKKVAASRNPEDSVGKLKKTGGE